MNKTTKANFDRSKPFNDLPDLPPTKSFLDNDVLHKWGLASRSLAELNRNIQRMPNPNMLINTISLQEAQTSTAIENIFTTEDELYKAVSDTLKQEQTNAATKEVLKYREALWNGYYMLLKNQEFNSKIAVSIFQQIKNTKQGIRPPQSQVVIKKGSSDLTPGEIIYTPPRGTDIVEKKMDNLFHFLNNEKTIDPLLKMAISHYQFEAIHPFTDGNGRTGRILNLLFLVQQQLLSYPVLYLSKYIINHKDEYYHLLAGVTQRQAWKPWLLFMMNGVENTAKYTNQLIDEIILQMDATYNHAHKKYKWYSMEVNHALFSQPYIKQKVFAEVTSIKSRTTLTKYLQQLIELGILSPLVSGREVFYINNDLVRILQS